MRTAKLVSIFVMLLGSLALAEGSEAAGGPKGPPKDANCAQIYNACQSAGFVVGEAKEGKGLWRDCVDPLMHGTTAKKSALPLPSVPANVIQACKAKEPKWGEGRVAN